MQFAALIMFTVTFVAVFKPCVGQHFKVDNPNLGFQINFKRIKGKLTARVVLFLKENSKRDNTI